MAGGKKTKGESVREKKNKKLDGSQRRAKSKTPKDASQRRTKPKATMDGSQRRAKTKGTMDGSQRRTKAPKGGLDGSQRRKKLDGSTKEKRTADGSAREKKNLDGSTRGGKKQNFDAVNDSSSKRQLKMKPGERALAQQLSEFTDHACYLNSFNAEFCHGYVEDEIVEKELQKAGDFLVRQVDKNNKTLPLKEEGTDERITVITLCLEPGSFESYPIMVGPKLMGEKMWKCCQKVYNNMEDLIKKLIDDKVQLNKDKSDSVLINPVNRKFKFDLDETNMKPSIISNASGAIFTGEISLYKKKIPVMMKEMLFTEPAFAKDLKRSVLNLNHEGVAKVYGVVDANPFLVISEFLQGDPLSVYLIAKKAEDKIPSDQEKIDEMLIPIAKAVEYLHDNHVSHLKLTTKNVFIEKDKSLKLADYSPFYAFCPKEPMDNPNWRLWPPEAFLKDKDNRPYLDPSSDVWSLGIVVIELFTNCDETPLKQFDHQNDLRDNFYPQLKSQIKFPTRVPTTLSKLFNDSVFVQRKKRFTMKKLRAELEKLSK